NWSKRPRKGSAREIPRDPELEDRRKKEARGADPDHAALIAAPSLMPQKIARLLEQTLDEEEFAWKHRHRSNRSRRSFRIALTARSRRTKQRAARPVRGAVGNLRQGAADFGGRRTGDGAKS